MYYVCVCVCVCVCCHSLSKKVLASGGPIHHGLSGPATPCHPRPPHATPAACRISPLHPRYVAVY